MPRVTQNSTLECTNILLLCIMQADFHYEDNYSDLMSVVCKLGSVLTDKNFVCMYVIVPYMIKNRDITALLFSNALLFSFFNCKLLLYELSN